MESLGYFIPSIYLPTFARSIGLSPSMGTLLVALVNAASVPSTIILGMLIDRFHVTTVILLSTVGAVISVFLFWGCSDTLPLLIVFSILYGLSAGGFVSTNAGVIKAVKSLDENIHRCWNADRAPIRRERYWCHSLWASERSFIDFEAVSRGRRPRIWHWIWWPDCVYRDYCCSGRCKHFRTQFRLDETVELASAGVDFAVWVRGGTRYADHDYTKSFQSHFCGYTYMPGRTASLQI